LFSRLTKKDYFHIFTHRGTHNWLEPFEGQYPPAILELTRAIRNGEENFILRNTNDIELMLRNPNYQIMRRFYFVFESMRAVFVAWVNLSKKQIKIWLRMV